MENEKIDKIETETEDDTELDKVLEESIESVKAGNALAPSEQAKPEEPKEETPEELKVEEPSTPPVDEGKPVEVKPEKVETEEVKPEGYEFRIPNKGKFESDESFEKRIELLDLVKKRKLAKTDDQRQQISEEIKTAKSNLNFL